MDFAEVVQLVRDELTRERWRHAEIVADLKIQMSAQENRSNDNIKIMIEAGFETSFIDCSMEEMILVQDDKVNNPPESSSINCKATDVELTYWEQQRGTITI